MFVISTDQHHVSDQPQRFLHRSSRKYDLKYTTDPTEAKQWKTRHGAQRFFASMGLRNHFIQLLMT